MEAGSFTASAWAMLRLWLRWLALVGLYLAAAARASDACSGRAATSATGDEESIVFSTVVQARAEDVWRVLADFERWGQTFPELASIRVTREAGAPVLVEQTTVTLGRRIRTTSTAALDATRGELRLDLAPALPQDLASMTSVWRVSALSGETARVELRLGLRSGHPVPRFVERRAAASAVRRHVEALADAVEGRANPRLAAR
jgi:hypothetical protein